MIDPQILTYTWYTSLICLIIPQLFILNWSSKYAKYFYINCLVRGLFPRIDVSRTCFFGGFISSVIVGRVLATIGELAFVLCVRNYIKQHLMVYRRIQRYSFGTLFKITMLFLLNYSILVVAILAEIQSWKSVIFKDNNYHVMEETLWFCMGIYTTMMTVFFKHWIPMSKYKNFNNSLIWISSLYCVYMFFVDIPMYLERAKTQDIPVSLDIGFWELWECQKISRDSRDYGTNMVFSLLYFGVAPYILDRITFRTWVIKNNLQRKL